MTAPAVAGAVSEDAAGGTYTLLVELAAPATVEVGALGAVDFAAGWYAYVGSALGAGGFSRVRRHRELAAGERETRHWHVDYLLGHPAASLDAVVASAGTDLECAVVRALAAAGPAAVDGFGCSDCGCDSHLVFRAGRERLLAGVEHAYRRARADGRATGRADNS
jgi:Uri superfamily endonuclease